MKNQWQARWHDQRIEAIKLSEQGKKYLQTMKIKRIDSKTEILIKP